MRRNSINISARRLIFILVIMLWFMFIFQSFVNSDDPNSCVISSPGVFDLSGCAFGNHEVYKLNGQWEFYWNQFINPEDLSINGASTNYIEVPSLWGGLLWKETPYSRYGYATYRSLIILPSGAEQYGLKLTNIRTSNRLFVNGHQVGQSGIPDVSRATAVSENNPYTAYFPIEDSKAFIHIQVSNYMYATSGISDPLFFGSSQAIEHLEKRNEMYDITVIISFLVMGIYFLGQGLQRRVEQASLYLALFCIMIALYMGTHSEKLLYDYGWDISYSLFSSLQFFSAIIGVWALINYTHQLSLSSHSALMTKLAGVCTVIGLLVIVIFGIQMVSIIEPIMLFVTFIISLFILYLVVKAIIKRVIGSIYLLIAMLGVIQFFIMFIANLSSLVEVYSQPPLGLIIFILAQGFFLATRSNHAYETIQKLTVELQQKSKDKDEFLLKTSNELRTPLQVMMHITRSMIEGIGGQLNVHQRKDMQLVEHTGKRLSVLMNDILDYERMKDGTIELERRSLDLYGLVEVVLEVFRHLYGNERFIMRNRIESRGFILYADENRVTQIVYNLVENARNHQNSGGVEVSAVMNSGWLFITVATIGQAYPEASPATWTHNQLDDLADIQDQSTDRNEDKGLGLPISRMLVRLHGGEFIDESRSDEYYRYTFSLPLVASVTSVYDETATDVEKAVLTKQSVEDITGALDTNKLQIREATYRILIVDEYIHSRALTNLLAVEGFEAVSVHSASEALLWLSRGSSYDLAVIDVRLPDISGFDLCRQIRQTYSPIDLPILLTTTNSQLGMNVTGLAAGANDLIRKPYEWDDLIARVRTLVELKRSATLLLNAEINMLRAQIKPHFLYNAINTIIWMSKRDIERTRQLLRDLSQFLRGSFDFENRESLVTIQNELVLVKAYLSLEQARFGDRLQVTYDIQETDIRIPPLVIQPIVENAVRHGIGEKEEGGTVNITVREQGTDIVIEVADDGVGMTMEQINGWNHHYEMPQRGQGTGIGLSNVNRRLIKIFGRKIQISPRDSGGTVVSIHLPRRE